MAEEDIYGNKTRYDRFLERLGELVRPPETRKYQNAKGGKDSYVCRNADNLKYFRQLIPTFEARDLAYVSRNRMLSVLKMVVHIVDLDLSKATRQDVDRIMAFMQKRYKSYGSQKRFVRRIRTLWRWLFPVTDESGNIDDRLAPYPVRHLSTRMIDKSKLRLRTDRLTFDEYQRIVTFFEKDPRMQAYVTFATESLGRPQVWLLKGSSRESPEHFFLVHHIAEYLRLRSAKVELFETRGPDIVFTASDGKKVALEIETGSLLASDATRLKEKVAELNRVYGKSWAFVVTHSDLRKAYRAFGQTFTKGQIKAHL